MQRRQAILDYLAQEKKMIDAIDPDEVERAIELLLWARDHRKNIYAIGNGGSAATASHFTGDFNKGLSLGKEKRFRFLCLSDNIASTLALANDVSYDDIFVEQLKNFAEAGDVVLAISGSGNSENVLRAVRYAREIGCRIIGLTGFDGGALMGLSDIRLHVAINDMQIVEDIHMIFNHMMMSILYKE